MPKVIILILLLAVSQHSLQASEETEGKAGKGKENKLEKCLKFVDEDTKNELEKGVCENDKTKKYLKCVYVSLFYMTCDGELNYGGVKYLLVHKLKSKEKGEAVAEKCLKSTDDSESTACKMFMCFRQSGVLLIKKKDNKQDAGSSTE